MGSSPAGGGEDMREGEGYQEGQEEQEDRRGDYKQERTEAACHTDVHSGAEGRAEEVQAEPQEPAQDRPRPGGYTEAPGEDRRTGGYRIGEYAARDEIAVMCDYHFITEIK